jgi:hypothetical protein
VVPPSSTSHRGTAGTEDSSMLLSASVALWRFLFEI